MTQCRVVIIAAVVSVAQSGLVLSHEGHVTPGRLIGPSALQDCSVNE